MGSCAALLCWSGLSVFLATLAAFLLEKLPHANLSLIFLTAALVVAVNRGLFASILTSLLGFLSYNFLFTDPRYTFNIEHEGDFATLLFFLLMAGLTGHIASRLREAITENSQALEQVSSLYAFTARTSAAVNQDSVARVLFDQVEAVCGLRPCIHLVDEGEVVPCSFYVKPFAERWPEPEQIEEFMRHNHEAEETKGGWLLVRLQTSHRQVGLLVIAAQNLDYRAIELIRVLCDQAAIALERCLLVLEVDDARIESERERLRSTLLSSVSHDLRTPLASIIGSATSLIEYGENIELEDQRDLLGTIHSEASRLDGYVQNLLDMTRLERENIKLQTGWVDVNDMISSLNHRLGPRLSKLRFEVEVAPEVTLICVQPHLFEQALVNVVENAIRYSPPNGTIRLQAGFDGDMVFFAVTDEGCGIPPADRENVFTAFFSGTAYDRDREGTGLGLAICRAVLQAHGGQVVAEERPGIAGTCIRMRLICEHSDIEAGDDL